ncbi:hypothetical protein [Haloprofundus sp. MHR1]|uniref:DUF7344 domain-containing protein n=1 Tax=Haloprofundus sp. MHR1 TaxID=2572921 RepID=UPI0010BE88CD|nr:hypothetical protein [Haloprofundus sp. MHR1]QCJ46278.1 hypothetical protein FCF25_03710 [Haloprofundus sp. MHR1]
MGNVDNSHRSADISLVREATTVDDEMFATLSDTYRRFVLYALLQFQQLSFEELADIVAGWTNAADWRPVTPEERDDVMLVLRHVHVPKLEAAGYVEYDDESDELVLDSLPASLYDLLTYARAHEGGSVSGDRTTPSEAEDSDQNGGSDAADDSDETK